MKTTTSKKTHPRIPTALEGLIDRHGQLTDRGYEALDLGLEAALDGMAGEEETEYWYVVPKVWMDRVHKADRSAGALSKPGYEGFRQRRPIGFAPWPSVPEWEEVIRDTETFSDQEERLREVLALPDDEDPLAM